MLSDETTVQFREAVQESIAAGSRPSETLIKVVAGIVSDARANGLSAEDVVIRIKDEWRAMVDLGLVPYDRDHGRLRDSLISAAIKAYYVQ